MKNKRGSRLTEDQLHHWPMVESFERTLEKVFGKHKLAGSLSDPRRKLDAQSYLSLFLLGLINPVVESMRGLCQASHLKRVQDVTGARAVSLGSFSEMQSVLDPELLHEVFAQMAEQSPGIPPEDGRLKEMNLLAQDGSLWSALPRMTWAEYGVGADGQARGVRLHLKFHLVRGVPCDARVDCGKSCERTAMRQMLQAGQINVGDRYYGEDYQLFDEIEKAGAFFVLRIKDSAVVHEEQCLPINQAGRQAGVVRHAWVRLGARQRSIRLRLVEMRCGTHTLLLVTNLPADTFASELIGLIYRRRWQIELYFRWIKCIFKNRHLFAESLPGVKIQMYLALIASLLLMLYTGRRPTKRQMEAIHFYLMGWASDDELAFLLQRGSPKTQKRA